MLSYFSFNFVSKTLSWDQRKIIRANIDTTTTKMAQKIRKVHSKGTFEKSEISAKK